jgi:hypothetical protein
VFGVAGIFVARSARERELVFIYGGITILAFWASFGPDAGLYAALYRTVPLFAWLRVPSRFGLIVTFGLAVLASLAIRRLLTASPRHATLAGVAIAVVAAAELRVPLQLPAVPSVHPVYRMLAAQPLGPVIEMPFYTRSLYQHTRYMLASTSHWMPLVNGYSDFIPPDFDENLETLAPFPSVPALKVLEGTGVRYAIFHWGGYNAENRAEAQGRLAQLSAHFRPLYQDADTGLYEIVSFPRE